MQTQIDPTVRGKLEAVSDELIVLAPDHSDYRLHLAPGGPTAPLRPLIGKRITGVIHARALRLFHAQAGGRFIEPIDGAPRIVQGSILSLDPSEGRALVDVGMPMWVTVQEPDRQRLQPGQLVNFYVHSGTSFVPAA